MAVWGPVREAEDTDRRCVDWERRGVVGEGFTAGATTPVGGIELTERDVS